MTTTAKRLRIAARHDESQGRMMNEAADLIEQQQREIKRLEREDEQVIDQRENYHEWADKLAHCIAEILQVEIGEHSSANNPWYEALEAWNIKSNRVATLEQENQALTAHIERLQSALGDILNPIPKLQRLADESGSNLDGVYAHSLSENHNYLREIAADALSVSPQTSLAEHDAGIARKSFVSGAEFGRMHYRKIPFESSLVPNEAEKHANKIRNGKDGE